MILLLQFVLIALSCVHVSHATRANPQKFLIVSTPSTSKISYVKIPQPGEKGSPTVSTLIGVGLSAPQGVAVDQMRKKLYVTDPADQKIFSYDIHDSEDSISCTGPTVVVDNTEARWVAVDPVGNVYYTDEPSQQILKLPADQVAKGVSTPIVLYDSAATVEVSAPGGIAADSFYTYWANKHIGDQVGSIIRGTEVPKDANLQRDVQALSANSDKSYGVCLALSNVFYTQPANTIYGVKNTGGAPQAINDRLINPRGCAYDGIGTVYVADRGAHAIFSFAGNMQELGPALLQKTVALDDAFGVAVFSRASKHVVGVFGLLLTLIVSVGLGL